MLSTYRQTGVSLISLMIGLLISMVALLGMMSLYGTVVKSTVESTRDARIAGERSSALLVATRELQGAGYGIDGATGSNDLLQSAAPLSLDEASCKALALDKASCEALDEDSCEALDEDSCSLSGGNTLFWQQTPPADEPTADEPTVECSGLHAPHSADQGGLYLLQPQPQPCSALTESEWQVRPLLIDNDDVDVSRLFSITLVEHDTSSCQALGIAGAGQISVRLSTTDRNGNSIISSSTCLLNFASGETE